jgi:hypothetical protein
VLTVECENIEAAEQALQGLPLVERKMIDLDLIPLAPFSGLTQLFQTAG